ncbi:MAG: RNA polymerase sigma factor [Clostridiales bacterium]|nr:RNA polymerase sigma factor [Clostridiales bacterium]
MKEQPDELTIRRAQRGEENAVELVLTACEGPVYRVCLSMLHSKEDALDVCQEALLKIYRSLGRFRFQSAFFSWVYRIAINACLDHLRKTKGKRQWEETIYQPRHEGLVAPEPDPFTAALKQDDAARVRRALDQLTEEHRAVLILLEYEGLSYEEIAKVLKISTGTVKSRIHRARRALMDFLREEPF